MDETKICRSNAEIKALDAIKLTSFSSINLENIKKH